jgi:NitT/TauT family transport system permease protein
MMFPGPAKVGATFLRLASDRTLLFATAVSLRRILIGYGISLIVGVPMGVLIARSRVADDTLGVVVSGFQALPSICWLPLALLWFGLSPNAILFVVVVGAVTSIAVTVKDGVNNLPPTYIRAAKTMGTKPLPMLLEVILPAVGPSVLTAAKVGWGFAWRALMSGELLFVSLGLGHLLMMGRELADMSQVLVVMGVIMTIGLLADRIVFGALEAMVRERWGLGTQ